MSAENTEAEPVLASIDFAEYLGMQARIRQLREALEIIAEHSLDEVSRRVASDALS